MTTFWRPARVPLSGVEWVALIVAVGIAHGFHARGIAYPSAYDAKNYLDIALDIARGGLFSKFYYSELRTYGYPLLLRALHAVSEAMQLPWTFVVFEAQLAAHVAAALFLRSRLAQFSLPLARAVLVTVLLNVVALVYVAETLGESVSLTLLMVAAACWIHVLRRDRAAWLAIAAGSLAIGAAIAVRPGNVFAVPAWIIALAAADWLRGASARQRASAAMIAVVALALPLVPQLVNNVRHHDAWTPLVPSSLGRHQQIWGIANLKYATALEPVALPSIYYLNPFAAGRPVDETRPLAWYAEHPLAGAATLALHTFGMLDQDLLFTYARDLDPWYRRPLGVIVHGVLALAVLGIALLAQRARHERTHRAVAFALVGFVLSHIALHATTAVEMRFGLPLLVLAGPLAAWYLAERLPNATTARRAAGVVGVIAWIAVALVLSEWMREQSPQIRAWYARGTSSPP